MSIITIPLFIFLFIFFGALLVLAAFYILNIAHIIATANLTFISFVVTFIVFALATFTLYGTWFFLQSTDWQQPVKIWDNNWIGGHNQFN